MPYLLCNTDAMNPRTIRVQGKGIVSQSPDRVRLIFTIVGKDPDFSKAVEQCNLGVEALRTAAEGCRSSLAAPDVDQINGAALRELHLRRKQGTNLTIHRADDVFSEIEARGHAYLKDFDLTRARFSLRVRGRRKALSLSLSPEDDALRGDTHEPLIFTWLDAVRLTTHRVLEEVLANT